MANVRCYKCGKSGDSKCPHCRTIFDDMSDRADGVDTILSYRMAISDAGIMFKRYRMLTGVRESEDDYDILRCVRDLLKDLTDDELRVVACVHKWEFAPCCGSSIGCGHHAPEKDPKEFLYDAIMYLQRLDSPEECPTQDDLDACTILKEKYDVFAEIETRIGKR